MEGSTHTQGNTVGFFEKILNKLGFDAGNRKVKEMLRGPAAEAASPVAEPNRPSTTSGDGSLPPVAVPAAAPSGPVDVAALLEEKAAANPQKLNWRTSIVDLLKLLDLDSSLQARKELATELGCPPAQMSDSAQMNMWLHKAVMRKLATNGGKVPADLTD